MTNIVEKVALKMLNDCREAHGDEPVTDFSEMSKDDTHYWHHYAESAIAALADELDEDALSYALEIANLSNNNLEAIIKTYLAALTNQDIGSK